MKYFDSLEINISKNLAHLQTRFVKNFCGSSLFVIDPKTPKTVSSPLQRRETIKLENQIKVIHNPLADLTGCTNHIKNNNT